ncbi:hypothetical protein ACFQS1_04685 [Paractinoplanes rhizophilus]|uniref:Cell division protein FtsL n=1 Tax=Paractinoplanes rhizophilus TaxID=1416877 RepID=A0ABW2HLB0_9ACTN
MPRARLRDGDPVRAERRAPDDGRADRRSGADLAHGKGRRPEPMIGKGRSEAARKRNARAGGRRPVLDAPVDGTAALKPEAVIDLGATRPEATPLEVASLETAQAEPLRVTPPARNTGGVGAPRLRVAPPAPVSAPRAPFVASVIGLVIVGVLGILLINTKTNENSFRIDDLKKQNTALDNTEQDLDNQLVAVSSIGNLDAAARRLGLVKEDHPALFTLPDGKIIGVPTPAKGKASVTAQDAATAGDAGTADNGTTADGSQMTTGTTSGTGTGATSGATGGTGTGTGTTSGTGAGQ